MKESFFADSPSQDKSVGMYPTDRKDGKAGHQMSKRPFADEELAKIRKNPYVEKATHASVKFTQEFKRHAYGEFLKGKTVVEVFQEAGFDVDVIGSSRMRGFRDQVRRCSVREEGFSDRRGSNYRRPPKTGEEILDQRVNQLEHELAYTRQEVEFLKKLQAANMEAQKQWESKHLQK